MPQRPIAIIGLACRVPQADDAETFWQNLLQGRDCIGVIPAERWNYEAVEAGLPDGAAQAYGDSAGALQDGDCYDAAFFDIKPNEAVRIDPQQGMMLEMAWHACENAGIPPDSLTGREVGVYVGLSTRDFDRRTANVWPALTFQTATGSCAAMAANRLSYVLGVTGPSMTIDTACASSLTALHHACRALDDGECEMALAGGVQLILSPTNILAFSRDNVLSKTGGCKPFSAKADGYVFSDGGGIVLLKPLDLALRDGDPVRAVIRGSAVNHNGRSNGLTAPYGAALQQVMQKALERAGVAADEVGYVEAHAVGTLIGDAIEMQAIRNVYATHRSDTCIVGSVKGNIGHLEAASGIAALIKAVMAVERGMLPSTLHCTPQSPLLRQDPKALRVCQANEAWHSGGAPRIAGVSAFGFGGANSHIIVEQPPVLADEARGADEAGPWVLMVSARSDVSFRNLCQRYAQQLDQERERGARLSVLRDFCRATMLTRQHHTLRRAISVMDWSDAIDGLASSKPVQEFSHTCRIGVDLSALQARFAAGELSPQPNAIQKPGRADSLHKICTLLGIKQLHIDVSAEAGECSLLEAYAAAEGLPVALFNPAAPPFSDCLVIVDAAKEAKSTDLQWDARHAWNAKRAALVTRCYDHGFTLERAGLAALFDGASRTLPNYPFERRRNHVLRDALVPAIRQDHPLNA